MPGYVSNKDRIEKVVKKYEKPFFFAEAGCMSTEGSKFRPNDWNLQGDIDISGQAQWFKAMFEAVSKRVFVSGFFIWDWKADLYSQGSAVEDKEYAIYGKEAENVIREAYGRF